MVISSKSNSVKTFNTLLLGLFLWPMIASTSRAASDICQIPLVEIILQQDFGRAFFCAGERLEQNPDDAESRLIFARAAQETGQFEIAVSFSERARQLQLSKSDRFASYLISGIARAGQGQFIAANLDLRRGSDFAESEIERNIIKRAITDIGFLSPWHYSLGFSVEPSSNINAGSMHDTMTWFGSTATISEDGQAQSGIAYKANVSINYIKPVSARLHWQNSLGVSATAYSGPGRNNAEYSLTSGLRYAPTNGPAAMVYGYVTHDKRFIAETVDNTAFADYQPYYNQTTLGLEYQRALDPASNVKIYTTFTNRLSDVSTSQEAQISTLGWDYMIAANQNVSLAFGGHLQDTTSDFATSAATAENLSVGADWGPARWPLTMSADFDYTHTEYENLIFGFAEERVDDEVSLEFALTHKNIQLYGYNPTFGVNWTRNYSNLNRYDTEALQVFTRLSTAF